VSILENARKMLLPSDAVFMLGCYWVPVERQPHKAGVWHTYAMIKPFLCFWVKTGIRSTVEYEVSISCS